MQIKKITPAASRAPQPAPAASPTTVAADAPRRGLAAFSTKKPAPAASAPAQPAAKARFFGFGKSSAEPAQPEVAPAPKKGLFSRAPATPKKEPSAGGQGLFIRPEAFDAPAPNDLAPDSSPTSAPESATKKAGSGFLRGFSKGRTAAGSPSPSAAPTQPAAEQGEGAAPGAKSMLKGFLARKPSTSPKAAEAKPSKVRSSTKKAPAKAGASRAKGAVHLLVELEDGRQLVWEATRDSLRQIDLAQAQGLLSFSRRDHRFSTDLPLTNKAATTLAVGELAEDARVVNASKNLSAVYATAASRVADFGTTSVGPGLGVVEALLPLADTKGHDRVAGLHLAAADGSAGLVVLYHINGQGDIGSPQVTVNPSDLSFVLAQFLEARRLDTDTTQVLLVANADLLDAYQHFKPYPSQATLLGMPLSQAMRMLAMGSFVMAAAAGGYAGYGQVQLELHKSRLSNALSDKTRALAEADDLLKGSLLSFSRTQALDAAAAAGGAQKLWVPGSRVTMDANVSGTTYVVELQLTKPMPGGTTPSVLERIELNHVKALLDSSVPEACSKSILSLTGGLNAAQITVECQNADGSLLPYRLD